MKYKKKQTQAKKGSFSSRFSQFKKIMSVTNQQQNAWSNPELQLFLLFHYSLPLLLI